jgi:CheY-like chemotaxis protein
MKCFLSSTYVDLKVHREFAAQAIERLGQQGIRMEAFGARSEDATTACVQEIEDSDAFFGIYAHRYGYIARGSSISITEREFDVARKHHKSTFCFVIDEDFPWPPKFIDLGSARSKLSAFKEKVSKNVIHDTFTTPDDLAYKVAAALGRFLTTQKVKDRLEKISSSNEVSTEQGRDQVSRRAARLESLIRGAKVVLVNDAPLSMKGVISILEELHVNVKTVTTSEEAISTIDRGSYDVIISDMRRGATADEGLRFLKVLRQNGNMTPTIFTVRRYEPQLGTPPYAFGITNRVDELLNLLFDVFERVRD